MNKVFYYPIKPNIDLDYTLVPENNLETGDQDYHKCPVWKHKTNRTFVGISPLTTELTIDLKHNRILTDTNIFSPLFRENYDLHSEYAVIQLTFPLYYFWVNNDTTNLWFEMLDYPLTSLNNNFIVIGGWWNLAGYPRSISMAIKVVDKNKKITIRKGDPLYRVRFYPENLNNGIKLIKSDVLPKEIKDQFLLNKSGDSKSMNRKLFAKRESNCPFKKYLNL